MEVLKGYADDLYNFYLYHHSRGDPRTKDWLLVENFTPTLALTCLYLLTVWQLPKLMRDRKPLQLSKFMVVYNLALVVLNFHICSELFLGSFNAGYSYICQPIKYSFEEQELRISRAIWWFYVSKLGEFVDTVIFILRKKNDQLSFLHVYHHATMFPIWWIGVKWVAGGQSFFGAMLNSGIHVLMYLYYGLAAIGPQMQKYLGWKRYLTQIQLALFALLLFFPSTAQFFLGMGNAYAGIYSRCDFPLWMGWALIIYGTSITALFANFYFHAYISGKRLGGEARKRRGGADDDKKGEGEKGAKPKAKSLKAQ